VFLQEIEHYASPVHHIGTEAMLRAVARGVAGSGGGRVYVKLHPVQSDAGTEAVRAQAAGLPGVEITAASLHDIAAAADVVVTQNSAAGFEALLQRKPVVTCAASDFHHATLVARNPAQLKRALAAAPAHAAGFDFAGISWNRRRRSFPSGPGHAAWRRGRSSRAQKWMATERLKIALTSPSAGTVVSRYSVRPIWAERLSAASGMKPSILGMP
jgi:hypothetical protein